jgi:hypothetical protein
MKTITKGDKVKAYLDGSLSGEVVDIIEMPANFWTMEGTPTTIRFCIVKLANGKLAKILASDLFIDY